MSDNNSPANPVNSSQLTSNDASNQDLASSAQNSPGPSTISKDPKENEDTNKDSILTMNPQRYPPTATDTADLPINSNSTNATTNMKDTEGDNESNDKETSSTSASQSPSTYEIGGITYRYGVAYSNPAQPANYQQPKWGVYPNMMSYVDDAGVKHEIHIPTRMYHRAVQLLVAEDWEELGKFPAYEGQKYTEADWYRLDDSDGDDGERGEDAQSVIAAGSGDSARVGDGSDSVGGKH